MRLTLEQTVFPLALRQRDELNKLGLKRDEVVGVVAETSIETIATLLALWSLGVTTWLMPLREPAHKLQEMAAFVGAKVLSVPLGERVGGFSLSSSASESFRSDVMSSVSKTLINTSGSTGMPKFVEHTLSQHFLSAQGVNDHVGFDQTQAWLLSLPLYHVGGLAILIRTLLAKARLIIPQKEQGLQAAICEDEPTHVSLVATQLKRLIALPGLRERLHGRRCIMLGGGPVPSWLSYERELPVIASYGATEMASTWTVTAPARGAIATQGSGQPLPLREVRLAHDGEICVRGPSLFTRYVGFAARKDCNGFYQTNDIGCFDEAGNLHLLGRKDNMFISGGENVHPEEIEKALLNHPSIEEAIVVGVRDAKWGERPVAFVRYSQNQGVEDHLLRAHLESTLARFKIPDHIFAWPHDIAHHLKPSRSDIRQMADALLG